MCVNCQYNNLGCCETCKWKTCYDELHYNEDNTGIRICDNCNKKRQKIGTCRLCGEIFMSRSKLFTHLKNQNHYTDYFIIICIISCLYHMNMRFNMILYRNKIMCICKSVWVLIPLQKCIVTYYDSIILLLSKEFRHKLICLCR